MLRVKDTYISTSDIKQIEYTYYGANRYLEISYRYDNEPIKIVVNSEDEYHELAEMICEKINSAVGLI